MGPLTSPFSSIVDPMLSGAQAGQDVVAQRAALQAKAAAQLLAQKQQGIENAQKQQGLDDQNTRAANTLSSEDLRARAAANIQQKTKDDADYMKLSDLHSQIGDQFQDPGKQAQAIGYLNSQMSSLGLDQRGYKPFDVPKPDPNAVGPFAPPGVVATPTAGAPSSAYQPWNNTVPATDQALQAKAAANLLARKNTQDMALQGYDAFKGTTGDYYGGKIPYGGLTSDMGALDNALGTKTTLPTTPPPLAPVTQADLRAKAAAALLSGANTGKTKLETTQLPTELAIKQQNADNGANRGEGSPFAQQKFYQTQWDQARIGKQQAQRQIGTDTHALAVAQKALNALPPITPNTHFWGAPSGGNHPDPSAAQRADLTNQIGQIQSRLTQNKAQIDQYSAQGTEAQRRLSQVTNSGGGGSDSIDNSHGGQYADLVQTLSQKYGVDPAAIHAIIKQESGGRPGIASVTNRNGSRDYGLMQVNSATKDPNSYNWKDPAANLEAGIAEFRNKLDQAGGDYHEAFHRYNGLGAPSSKYADPVYSDYQRLKGGGTKVASSGSKPVAIKAPSGRTYSYSISQ